MKKLLKKFIPLLLVLAGLLSACGSSSGDADAADQAPDGVVQGKEVTRQAAMDNLFSLNYDPEGSMNPITAESSANMQFSSLLYDSVFTLQDDFTLTSEVVTSYTSDDFVWWVFNIDTSILFSDGTNLTAEDIVYSIKLAQSSDYYKGRLNCLYGISVMGEDCFAITTYYPNSQFPSRLTIPIIKAGTYYDDVPIGSGPYVLAHSGDRLVISPNYRHADSLPVRVIYLKDCMDTTKRIASFEKGEIDFVTNDPTSMFNLGYGIGNEVRTYNTSNMHYIGFNMDSLFFQSIRSRYALNYVINRELICESLLDGCGVPAALPVNPVSPLYDADYAKAFNFDIENAEDYFLSAGFQDYDDDGKLEVFVTGIIVELNIRFLVNTDSTAKLIAARQICKNLNAIGIHTTLVELSWDNFIRALENGDYDMYYGEVRMTPDWDLSYLFDVDSGKKKDFFYGQNYCRIRDDTYGKLYSNYLAADEQSRRDAFLELSHYIGDNAVIIPICFEKRQLLTHRGVVTGLSPTQYDPFNKITEWTIDLEN